MVLRQHAHRPEQLIQGLGLAVAFVIGIAIAAANLPFFNERLFALLPLPGGRPVKPLWLRAVELIVLYAVVGFIARTVENQIGAVARQGWEFYAVTACLFIVAAYPGFVWRYLRRAGRQQDS
ncbi:DUF2818 family protein [soil metagenome]